MKTSNTEFQEKIDSIKARFGDIGAEFKSRLDRLQRGNDNSYAYGCVHNLAWSNVKANARVWNEPMPIPCYNVKLTNQHLGRDVAIGGVDPFQWMDRKYGASLKVIKENFSKPLTLSTRSDLIATDEYSNELNVNLHSIRMHVLNLPENQTRILEPGAPSIKRRIQAARSLQQQGFKVTLVLDSIDGLSPLHNVHAEDCSGLSVERNSIAMLAKAKARVESELGVDFKTFTPIKSSTREAAARLGLRLIQGGAL